MTKAEDGYMCFEKPLHKVDNDNGGVREKVAQFLLSSFYRFCYGWLYLMVGYFYVHFQLFSFGRCFALLASFYL